MKAAVYCGTRNVYEAMVPAVRSLIAHSNVEKVYLFIEDDVFPHEMPEICEVRNVSGQTFFPKDGANYGCMWT